MWAYIGLAGLVFFELGWLRTQYFLSVPIGLSKAQVMRMMMHDPPMGSFVDGPFRSAPYKRKATYILYMQECACNPKLLGTLYNEFPSTWRLEIVLPVEKMKNGTITQRLPSGVDIILDGNMRLHKDLNVCFMPLSYLLDENGKLIWKQTEHDIPLQKALAQAIEFWHDRYRASQRSYEMETSNLKLRR